MKRLKLLPVIFVFGVAATAMAQVPSIINYQGRLSAGGTNVFNGPGQFKFALVSGGKNLSHQAAAVPTVSGGFLTEILVTDAGSGYLETPTVAVTDLTGSNVVARATMSGGVVTAITVVTPGHHYSATPTVAISAPPPNFLYVTYWSNDGSSSGGTEPNLSIPLLVNQGLFSVNLGDIVISNMTAEVTPSIFTNPDVRLRIWFSDGVSAFQQFYPDQRLTSSGYAMMAGNVVDGAITSAKLGAGAVGTNALAANSISSANISDGAITTDKLADGAVTAAKLTPGLVSGVPNGMAIFASSGTWSKPPGVKKVFVKAWGGGGGGAASDPNAGGAGGGGGGYSEGAVMVSSDVAVTVGAGGGAGQTGGTSAFAGDATLAAYGGAPAGGRVGGGGGDASGGMLNLSGNRGKDSSSYNPSHGGMGGNGALGGQGGPGGLLGSDSPRVAGYGGSLPGGGGGGAAWGGGAVFPPGTGAAGMIVVYY